MPFTGLAIAGAISGGSSLLGGLFGFLGSGDAAKQQEQAEQNAQTILQQGEQAGDSLIQGNQGAANNLLSNVYGTNENLYAPYTQAGGQALSTLQSDLAPGGQFNTPVNAQTILQNDPGYQFRLQQGEQAVQRSAAAQGGALGGGTLKALTDYAQGAASSEYGNAFNRYLQSNQQLYSQLSGVANLGANATNQLANQGNIYANTASSNLLQSALGQASNITQGNSAIAQAAVGKGNAAAAGTVGGYNALSGALGGISNTATSLGLLNYLGLSGTNGGLPNNGGSIMSTGTVDPSQAAPNTPGVSINPPVTAQPSLYGYLNQPSTSSNGGSGVY